MRNHAWKSVLPGRRADLPKAPRLSKELSPRQRKAVAREAAVFLFPDESPVYGTGNGIGWLQAWGTAGLVFLPGLEYTVPRQYVQQGDRFMDVTIKEPVWEALSHAEKNHRLYLSQKHTLELFLERGAITRAQYDKSLRDLTEKMGGEG